MSSYLTLNLQKRYYKPAIEVTLKLLHDTMICFKMIFYFQIHYRLDLSYLRYLPCENVTC